MLLNLQGKCCLLFTGLYLEDHYSGCFFITMHSSNTGPSLLFPPCSSRGFTTGADVRKCGCFCGFLTGSEELQIVQKVVGQFIFPDVEQRKTPLKCWFLAKESCTFSLAFQIKNKEQAKKNLKNKIRYH